MHVDDYIDDYRGDKYSRFVLMLFRLSASLQVAFQEFTKQFKLYCTYAGTRYRCTGASRLGPVWLRKDLELDYGYDLSVDVAECSDWSSESVTH